MRNDEKPIAKATIAPLRKVQNEYLRKVTGAYKRTPRAALEREASIIPINIYIYKPLGISKRIERRTTRLKYR